MNRSSNSTTEAPLDPKVAAELAALDAALRGDAIDDDALAALVRDVQAQAPAMPTELREQLRDDVAAGFPRRGASAKARKAGAGAGAAAPTQTRRPRRSFAFGSGIAVAAVCVVFVAGAALQQGGSDDMTSAVPQSASDTAASRSYSAAGESSAAEPSGVADADSTAAGVPSRPPGALNKSLQSAPSDSVAQSSGGALAPFASEADDAVATAKLKPAQGKTSTPASGKRRVEQAVDLTVRVKSGKLDEAAGKVGDITRGAGGYVADSQVSVGTRGAGSASFTLQVASSKLDQAIDRLSDLGTVTSQNQSSTDITSSFDSANQRLGDAKAVRKALLRSLAKADGAGEIASLRSRIADNRTTISGLESEILKLERRTNLTTIDLSLTARSGDAPAGDDDGQWSIGDAAGDAVGILGTVSGVLLVGAAALLPFALIGFIAWALYRVRRKRQRDAVLDD